MLIKSESRFITFREVTGWRGAQPIVGFAPKALVRMLVSSEEMSAVFGGYVEYEARADGERYLGVWGARKVNRLLRMLRNRGASLVVKTGKPDQFRQRHRASG